MNSERVNLQKEQITLEAQKSVDQMQNSLSTAELLQYQNVKAPVSGVVFDPKVRAQGFTAWRENTFHCSQGLYAEVLSLIKIGFVKPGQQLK